MVPVERVRVSTKVGASAKSGGYPLNDSFSRNLNITYIYIYRSPFSGQIQQAVISIVTYYTSCLSEDSPNAHDSNPKQC